MNIHTYKVLEFTPVREFAFVRVVGIGRVFVPPRVARAYAKTVAAGGGGVPYALIGKTEKGPVVTAWATGAFDVEVPPPNGGADGFNWAAKPGRSGWCNYESRIVGIDEQRVTLFDGGWPMPLAVVILTQGLSVMIGGSNNQMHVPAGTRVLVTGRGSTTGSGRARVSARVTVLEPTPEAVVAFAQELVADAAIAAYSAASRTVDIAQIFSGSRARCQGQAYCW